MSIADRPCDYCGTEWNGVEGRRLAIIVETPEETPRARFRVWGCDDAGSVLLHECAHGVPLSPDPESAE